jgi:hypothetical protein
MEHILYSIIRNEYFSFSVLKSFAMVSQVDEGQMARAAFTLLQTLKRSLLRNTLELADMLSESGQLLGSSVFARVWNNSRPQCHSEWCTTSVPLRLIYHATDSNDREKATWQKQRYEAHVVSRRKTLRSYR